VPDIVVFTQDRGAERVWVTESEVEWWLAFWHRGGVPATRYSSYRKGGFFFTDDEWGESLRTNPQRPRLPAPK
jgi:hypothetical protein